jgi:gluconolactonase
MQGDKVVITSYDNSKIVHIANVDHPESIGIGPDGEAYTTGTGCQVYRLDLETNTAQAFASTKARCLGQVIDADGNLYAAHCGGGDVLKITPAGEVSVYATAPDGGAFPCANYPAFDAKGNMYLSDSGSWGHEPDGHIYRVSPQGVSELWYPDAVDTPNAIALDADESHLYFVETYGSAIARVVINDDGSAGAFERVVHMPRTIPDGIAFDSEDRLWIACHRPDAIYCFDPASRRVELFCEDWKGEMLRGPTDIAFAGPDRDIMLAASLDNLVVHRFDNTGVVGLRLNNPRLPVP